MIDMQAKAIIDCPTFRCPPNMTTHLKRVFEGEYDVPVVYSAQTPVVLDLGANYGAFSVWASHRWPGCKVHSYEPNPAVVTQLRQNLSYYPNVEVNGFGIGDPGERTFSHGPANTGESSFLFQHQGTDKVTLHVEDPLTLPQAQILKMDIEGCETEVLPALIENGRSFDAIMFEFHHRMIRIVFEDLLRGEYVLTGAHLYNPDLGVLRFVNRRHI